MTTLIVIRHGFSVSNAERRYTGQQDVPLSPLGREQAVLVADYLCQNTRIDAIYASDLCRAVDTVAPTAKRLGLAVIPEPGLRETDVGEWTGRAYEEVRESDADLLSKHRADPDTPCPGGECHRQVFDRVRDTVYRLLNRHRDQTVVIATHAMPARCIEALSAGHGIEQIGEHRVAPNASIRVYTYEQGHLLSQGRNIVSHLAKPGELLPDELV
ncbi:MAG: histidine phosphatase family protein [Ruminococcaceae bacterium]|nr:histidine phosphatase family protein [Oscillospiraceae bacterium]